MVYTIMHSRYVFFVNDRVWCGISLAAFRNFVTFVSQTGKILFGHMYGLQEQYLQFTSLIYARFWIWICKRLGEGGRSSHGKEWRRRSYMVLFPLTQHNTLYNLPYFAVTRTQSYWRIFVYLSKAGLKNMLCYVLRIQSEDYLWILPYQITDFLSLSLTSLFGLEYMYLMICEATSPHAPDTEVPV